MWEAVVDDIAISGNRHAQYIGIDRSYAGTDIGLHPSLNGSSYAIGDDVLHLGIEVLHGEGLCQQGVHVDAGGSSRRKIGTAFAEFEGVVHTGIETEISFGPRKSNRRIIGIGLSEHQGAHGGRKRDGAGRIQHGTGLFFFTGTEGEQDSADQQPGEFLNGFHKSVITI